MDFNSEKEIISNAVYKTKDLWKKKTQNFRIDKSFINIIRLHNLFYFCPK